MGFFSKLVDGVGDFFGGGGGGGDIASSLLDLGTTFVGDRLARDANKDAANTLSDASFRNAAEIRRATDEANRRFEELQGLSRVGTDALREIAASDPGQLTPAQQIALQDSQRDAVASLNATGLRGAGRSTVAALQDVDSRFRAGAIEDNLTRKQQAASRLSGEDFAAGRSAADTSFRGIATAGNTEAQAATPQASADLANANLRGGALADVSSLIADEVKTRGRLSKYDDKKEEEVV